MILTIHLPAGKLDLDGIVLVSAKGEAVTAWEPEKKREDDGVFDTFLPSLGSNVRLPQVVEGTQTLIAS